MTKIDQQIRTSPVRFTKGPLGLVRADDPHRFVERTVGVGDTGRLLVQGDGPFNAPDGYVLVLVDGHALEPDALWCPVPTEWLEVVR